MLGKIIAVLGALAGLSRIAGLLKWLPGVGPFAAAASAVLAFLTAIARMFFQGLTVIVSNPVTLVTVGVLCMASAGGGLKLGVEWTEHRVATRQAKLDAIKKELKDVDEQAKQDVRAAETAREQAEQEALLAAERAEHEAKRADAARQEAAAVAAAAVAGRLRATGRAAGSGRR